MAYCVIDDLLKILPEQQLIRLTDDESSGSYDTDRVQEAIDSAAEEMDVYLGSRFDLPISGTIPPILGKINADIAVYNLYSRKKESIPETRSDRYKARIKLLEKIKEGKISIGIQPPPSPPGENDYQGGSHVSTREKSFGEDTMNKY